MKFIRILFFYLLNIIITVYSIPEDIKNLYDFFKWELPSNGNGCSGAGITCTNDKQYVSSL